MKAKDYYGPEVKLKNGKKVRRKWKNGYWYSLCLTCFLRYGKYGGYSAGYCDVKHKLKCALCGGECAPVEFYPSITHKR